MKKIIIAIVVALMASASIADLISVTATNTDRQAVVYATSNVLAYVLQTTARVGDDAAGNAFVYIVPFKLPALTGGTTISEVSLDLYAATKTSFSANNIYIDILGIRVDSSSTVLTNDAAPGSATLIADNVQLVNKDVTVPLSANYTLNTSYFQNIYDNDANAAGKYVFLLLRTDGIDPIASNSYLSYSTADDAIEANRPVLNLTTIPEPATVGMLGFGALITLVIRRIRR